MTRDPARDLARATTSGAAKHFRWQGWAVLAEVSAPDDAATGPSWRQAFRRCDLLAARKPQRRVDELGGLERLALEVKVTRADFMQDVRRPEKQAPWRALAHRHAYVVPEGLVDKAEVPGGSGLLTVKPDRHGRPDVTWALRAPYTGTSLDVPEWLTRSLAYRAGEAEARIAGWADAGETVEDVRAELERTRHLLGLAEGRAGRERAAAHRWQQLYGATSGLPCATCGQPVRPDRVRDAHPRWRHVRPESDPACEVARTSADRVAGTYGTYSRLYVDPIAPREDPPT